MENLAKYGTAGRFDDRPEHQLWRLGWLVGQCDVEARRC
jgi:hypothetical protein